MSVSDYRSGYSAGTRGAGDQAHALPLYTGGRTVNLT